MNDLEFLSLDNLGYDTFINENRDLGEILVFQGETGESSFQPRGIHRGQANPTCVSGFNGYWASQMVLVVKSPPASAGRHKRPGFDPWVGKIPWRRAWLPTPVFLPGESHGQRSLMGYSPQGPKESDTTEATYHACTLMHPFTSLRGTRTETL